MSDKQTPINTRILLQLWPQLSAVARVYANQLITSPQNRPLPEGFPVEIATLLNKVAQADTLTDVDVRELQIAGVIAPNPDNEPPPPELVNMDANQDLFRVQAQREQITPPIAPNVTPADAEDLSPARQMFSDRAEGPADLTGYARRGGRTRSVPEPAQTGAGGPVAEQFGIDLDDPSTYVIGDDGRIYPAQTFDVFASEPYTQTDTYGPVESEFVYQPTSMVVPEQVRRDANIASVRKILADDTGGVTYTTLEDLQVTYYQNADVWSFWTTVNDMEASVATQLQAQDQQAVQELMQRYDVLDGMEIQEFDLKDKYSWVEMNNLPLLFTPEQTAFLNAKFETLGLYSRYGLVAPQYVQDNQDLNFGRIWKFILAEAVGRGTTIQSMFDDFAAEQVGRIETALAEFDDRTIANALDRWAVQNLDRTFTANEFTAIKNSLSMFDTEITEEEMTNNLAAQLETLSQPEELAMGQPVYSTFMREAEQKLNEMFKDDPRRNWMRMRRQTANPISAKDYVLRQTYEDVSETPAIIEQQEDMA